MSVSISLLATNLHLHDVCLRLTDLRTNNYPRRWRIDLTTYTCRVYFACQLNLTFVAFYMGPSTHGQWTMSACVTVGFSA